MNAHGVSSFGRWMAGVLVLSVGYYVSGWLALLLAIPPGYATAIWPAAGVALGGLLWWGWRAWPGIWLGSFLVNVGTGFDTSSASAIFQSIALASGIALGAAVQALVGFVLVRRYVGIPNPLNRERDVAVLLLLAGPVSCLINATVGVSSLGWAGKVQASGYAFTWWTWWVGDTIGAFLVTPLLLLWGDRSQPDWPRRPITVSVPLGVMAALFVALFVYVSGREQDRIRLAFEFQANTMTQSLGNRLEHVMEALGGLKGFESGRPGVDRGRFAKVARNMLARRAAVQTLSWNPRVTEADRIAFERAGRGEGFPSFSIVEEAASARLVSVSRRDEYFPVLYVEPLAGNEKVLGFDVASESDRLEALRRARDTGNPAATAPLLLVQDSGDEQSILVFLPTYRDGVTPDTIRERRSDLVGFVVAMLRISHLTELVKKHSGVEGIDFGLRDVTVPKESDDTLEGEAKSSIPARTATIEVAGRRWALRFALTPEYLAAHRSMQAWSVLAGGMLFTGLMGAVLLVVTGRAALIAGVVRERTGELGRANAELVKEIVVRRRAEDERDRFFLLSIDLFCVAGFDGFFKRVNESFTRTLGYSMGELLGVPFLDFVHPEDRESTLAEVAELAGGGVTIDFENRYRCKDGSYKWLQWNSTAFADQQVIYAVAREVTERKREEQQLREFNEILEQRVSERTAALELQSQELRALIDALSRSNQELDDFAYIASHDLKEPMRGIGTYASFLVEDYSDKLDEEGRAKLETLQRLCGRMTSLLDALLTYSRLGRTDLAVGEINLNVILGEVLDSLRILFEERGVTVRVPTPLPVTRCDRARIGEIFRNLISNSIKYNDKREKWVEVGFRCPEVVGAPTVFHVRDNGIGIREKHLDMVFKIFKRLHARDQFGGGTGAGLTITKKIVERHGGRIWVESVFGEGTTFFFTLHGEATQ